MNDENCGVVPTGKHSGLSQDIFSLDQSTGRPSILRPTENLPNRTVAKGIKVQNLLTFDAFCCFVHVGTEMQFLYFSLTLYLLIIYLIY